MKSKATPPGKSWFKAYRSPDAMELMKRSRTAFCLLHVIYSRARYSPGYNAYGLAMGEALVGDHQNYGMTRQQYRTALNVLVNGGFVTTKANRLGTIARPLSVAVFGLSKNKSNHQNQPAANQRPTTILEGVEGIEGSKSLQDISSEEEKRAHQLYLEKNGGGA